jgi:hypothetical protein
MSTCCSIDTSTAPGTVFATASIFVAATRSASRSSPNSFTAMADRVPESR